MKILSLLLCCLGVMVVRATAAAPPLRSPAETMDWLAGAWAFERNGRETTENWVPQGRMLVGVSRTAEKGKTVGSEFLVIREFADGSIYYVAKPSGQAETAFRLVRATEREAIFENKEHDFPQRITYTLRPDGSLLAAIEGKQGGKTRRVEFPYRRQK